MSISFAWYRISISFAWYISQYHHLKRWRLFAIESFTNFSEIWSFGLWPFWFGRFGLWTAGGRLGLWLFGLWPYRVWLFRSLDVMSCYWISQVRTSSKRQPQNNCELGCMCVSNETKNIGMQSLTGAFCHPTPLPPLPSTLPSPKHITKDYIIIRLIWNLK